MLIALVVIVGLAVCYDIGCNISLYRMVKAHIEYQEAMLQQLRQQMLGEDDA